MKKKRKRVKSKEPVFDPSCNGYGYHVHTPGADKCSICGKDLAKIRALGWT